ncbi:MAG: AraC family transcriptional regulator [Deltaproteobacteria bacterium]|nr:AraC family transcriptional regulator [Deltaproteobacteria bacterium]
MLKSILGIGSDSPVAELDASFAGRVRALMRDNLAENHALDLVSDRLSLKPRALQRLLAEEGTSFIEILDDEREMLAKHHLAQKTPMPAIAALLGYACVTGFHRAFRRWTGSTPAAYRRKCRRDHSERTPDAV